MGQVRPHSTAATTDETPAAPPASPRPAPTPQSIWRAEKSLDRMHEWIARHDARSAAVLGVSVAMLGALSAALPPQERWTPALNYALALTIAGFSCVILQLLNGQFPRLRKDRPSMFFFGTIADYSLQDYTQRFSALSDADYLQDVLHQCHTNARILRSKFRAFKFSIIALLITIAPWTVALTLARSLR